MAQIASAQQAAPRWESNRSVPLMANLPDVVNVQVPQFDPLPLESPQVSGEQGNELGHLGADGRFYLDQQPVWQIAPTGIIYRSYYAGLKEPRMAAVADWDTEGNSYFDGTIGGRFGLLRYGNTDGRHPQGWQLDIEAAAFPRLDFEEERDLVSGDFRVGVPLTYGQGPVQYKLAYYHVSAHIGDEFYIKNPMFDRINYVRDGLAFGVSYDVEATELPIDARLYGEADWSFNADGGAEPWELQFGVELVGSEQGPRWCDAAPFLAIGGHLRQEVDFGGNLVVQTGLLWRALDTTGTLRFGFEYVNGKTIHYQLFNTFEQRFGIGLWYDF